MEQRSTTLEVNMNNNQKNTAPRAATPETENRKILSINSILKTKENVKVVIKRPGEIPQVISAFDIPPEFLSKKLRCGTLGDGFKFTLVYDPKSRERMNISADRAIYRGTVLIIVRGFRRLFDMTVQDTDKAFVWLMCHRI